MAGAAARPSAPVPRPRRAPPGTSGAADGNASTCARPPHRFRERAPRCARWWTTRRPPRHGPPTPGGSTRAATGRGRSSSGGRTRRSGRGTRRTCRTSGPPPRRGRGSSGPPRWRGCSRTRAGTRPPRGSTPGSWRRRRCGCSASDGRRSTSRPCRGPVRRPSSTRTTGARPSTASPSRRRWRSRPSEARGGRSCRPTRTGWTRGRITRWPRRAVPRSTACSATSPRPRATTRRRTSRCASSRSSGSRRGSRTSTSASASATRGPGTSRRRSTARTTGTSKGGRTRTCARPNAYPPEPRPPQPPAAPASPGGGGPAAGSGDAPSGSDATGTSIHNDRMSGFGSVAIQVPSQGPRSSPISSPT